MSDDCGQEGVCAKTPGCSRHWAERVREVMDERDLARAKADAYERDWYEAKSEFGTATAKLREKVRTLEAALTTETRVALDYQNQRDEALAQVARREREHEALLETAQKALAHVEAERDALQVELDDTRDASAYKFCGTYLEDVSGGRWWGHSHMSYARAEIEMLRGIGCREGKLDEPESGPCGLCLKCAEKRGAKWALDSVGWSREDDRWSIAERICRDARRER